MEYGPLDLAVRIETEAAGAQDGRLHTVRLGRDGLGRVTLASDNNGRTEAEFLHETRMAYNGLGQAIEDVQTHGRELPLRVRTAYNGVGNRVTTSYPLTRRVLERKYLVDEQLSKV